MKNQINNQIGKKVIVRADKAGIFYGTLVAKNDSELQLNKVRKLYYWSGANAVEQIAHEGVKNPDNCKFTVIVDEITVSNYIQILTCTPKAIENIENVKEWKIY
jgi:hypothetical protein